MSPLWPKDFAVAQELLLKAAEYAELVRCPHWQFAVEIGDLRELGLSRADLRYLVAVGLLEHANEVLPAPDGDRRFQSLGKLTFSNRTCFILTAAGRAAA